MPLLDNISNEVAPDRLSLYTAAGTRRVARGMNENFARELLELHTLGEGAFTEDDVREVARAFTGWRHSRVVDPAPRMLIGGPEYPSLPVPVFEFDSLSHDAEAKRPFGLTLAAGRGMEDGEDVLDYLARSPRTARHLARKLAVRFVSDDPPASLVDRAAVEYLRTDGDIGAVVRSILMSVEFRSPANYGAKIKSPLGFLLSMRRALNAPLDTAGEAVDLLIDLGQPSFGRVSPDGWPETGARWMSAGQLAARVDLIERVVDGRVPSIPLDSWPEWPRLWSASFEAQLAGVVSSVLGDQASATTLAALRSVPHSVADEHSLRQLLAVALSSPEFQRR